MTVANAAKKWVYLFHEGSADMKDLLGGKGAGLAEMTQARLPVPPGFTVTTEACNAYYRLGKELPPGLWEQVLNGIKSVEQQTGKGFGDSGNPLLVSVRSGAPVSMPGMMDTILNLGLNTQTLQGLIQTPGGERFAYDAYRRFVQMFSRIVLDVSGDLFEEIIVARKGVMGYTGDTQMEAFDWKFVTEEFKGLVHRKTKKEFPEDPYEQLQLAIRAVMESWNGRRAVDYRNHYRIPHDTGTAVNIVAMVFGNMDENSGTGVAFTRDPATGERILYGEYLMNAQGEDVVAGIRTPRKIAEMASANPGLYQELSTIARRLEQHYRDAQDMEFTIERGKLYMLQTRSAKRTAQAAMKMAVDMAEEGLVTEEEALLRVEPAQINQLLLPRFDAIAKDIAIKRGDLLATGLNASPGAASGKIVFHPDRAAEMGERNEGVILVRTETNPDDVHGMLKAKGILTARGGATSHAAVVARGLGKPCVAGCEALEVDYEAQTCRIGKVHLKEMDEISIDGATGQVFLGRLPTTAPSFAEQRELRTLLNWANQVKRLGVWANADTPEDAQRALEYGAEGIGLCRTEHMFFAEERLPVVRQMILAAPEASEVEDRVRRVEYNLSLATAEQRPLLEQDLVQAREALRTSRAAKEYHHALERLWQFQTEDFKSILKAMTGKPVIIRLLDPPLHEFLPRYEDLLVEFTEMRLNGAGPNEIKEKEELLRAVENMKEANPMLGLRGCRLGLMYGAINEMQARAIMTAACELKKEGYDPQPEIMVPLVGYLSELSLVKEVVVRVCEQVQHDKGVKIPYKVGTMIELPRAALMADEIAREAEFFSFGTNDLTQTTLGISRDDAEGKFLLHYVTRGILKENPFQVLDRDGVGQLIQMGVERGRRTRPGLHVGICGEHGGDPSSIEFCHNAGLDYVSCSPFRVPVARLAAAQAALGSDSAHGMASTK
ncbi:MAG: pyruvate, phosphate dikinase [Chloroflexi bacterium]|nr:pyruvate, phosphate dikinase [Chloroflexota bacterium]